MAQVRVTPAQFAAEMKRLGDQFKPAAMRGLRAAALRVIPLLQHRTDMAPKASPNGQPGAVDTGRFKAAWKTRAITNGVSVYNDMPYARVIEGGRRKSPVSRAGIQQLEGWAKRKLRLPPEEARAAAFAIAKTLQKRPLFARKIVEGGVEEIRRVVIEEIKRELAKTVRR